MCVGVPMQVLGQDGIAGRATDGTAEHLIDLTLTGPLAPGTWVLTQLGCAREVISADEARLIADALEGLRSVMAGGDGNGAFADLHARTPSLPPHLAAAQSAGKTTA
ncbi:HypC/HybG/HupF family hydrogenase formation chaperone [Jannaschia seohaensis]|uniref:Hydrogenase expression/formation protein HypC n=1 Tax=Jannaschia seohaensis TaxID=475081 RepID=A0A2Y9A7H4_9RHOB|nr:HypC/HybG/HupF family hydrogenase formation chaperone [Jannaschia seohaensis]PWJ21849.1 hydrogenase expression/formation protein HypC [Jannaschia seohaensis]SSA38127.1 hydrogenase expression/formation protein HypC [Jannaschia seohaensis]